VGGVNDIADPWWEVSMTPLTKLPLLLFSLKGISIKSKHRQIVLHYSISTAFAKKYGLSKKNRIAVF
jgi:hypothetical protein